MKKLLQLICLMLVVAPARAAITFVQTNGSTDSLTVTLTGVTAGNLIVIAFRHEGATTTYSVSDGTSTFTNGTVTNHANGDLHALLAYLLVANSGNKTYTMTLGAGRSFYQFIVLEYDYPNTLSFDTQAANSGTSTAMSSGNITTTGTDEVVIAGGSSYFDLAKSAHQINAVAANLRRDQNHLHAWDRIVTATFTGAATATLASSDDWITNVIAFKDSGAGGGGAQPPTQMMMGVGD